MYSAMVHRKASLLFSFFLFSGLRPWYGCQRRYDMVSTHDVLHRPLLLSLFSFSGSRHWGDGIPKTLRHGLDNTTSTTGHFEIFFTSSFAFEGTKHAAIRGSSHTEFTKTQKKKDGEKGGGKRLREKGQEGRTGSACHVGVPRNLGCE